ncbi:F0F1 ATP synthase subunit delta [Lactobacillus amylovorus DSM 20531]|uniref:ATP synthase F1 subunit delta n=1 Tax=Lactobacillus amylovorus TaxID=1604 RepID=UPI000C058AF6|nr:ATP synthase F1 subunit delta [Lactobacillus amylovorus]ATO53780.1 F0F1 ATP synthase subunit delta [Lactobacillus amylovorus DSM 20531]
MALSREEIAARYGTALFGYAQDNKVLDTVYDEMMELKKAAVANPKFISVLSDPILSSKDKKSLLTAVEKDFSDEVQGFLNLLLEYNRFADLIDIIDEFALLYDDEKKIAAGTATTATTAVKLDDDQLKRLGDSYAKKYDLNAVRLENKVDPSILGGVVLRVKDCVIDGSVKNRLKKIRAQIIDKN